MANDRIEKKDISVKDPAGDYIKSLEEATKVTKEAEKATLSFLESTKKMVAQYKAPTNIKEVKALSDAVAKADKGVEDLNKTRNAQLQIDKELKKARADEARILKQGIKEQKELERAVKSHTKAAQKARKTTVDNANAFKQLTKQTNNAQARFKRLAAQYGVTSKAARSAEITFRNLDDRLRKINNTARDGRRDVGRYGLALKKVGGIMSTGLGAIGLTAGLAGLARGFGNMIGIFSGFEKANSQLQAVLGDSGTKGNMDLLKQSAQELGASTAFTASEVAGLQIEFAKLGFNPKQIDDATESTLALAAASGTELAEAAAVTGATLGGFGLDAAETGRVTDVMAKSFSTSALDMEKFKESMKSAAPAAKAVGISVEKTTALLGTLANAGIAGSKAGNNLKTSLIKLNDAGLTLDEGLKKVADSEDKLGAAAALVGKNAAASFLVLAEGTEVTAGLEAGLNNAAGAAQKMADIQLDNLAGDVTILGSAFEGAILAIESGEGAINSFLRGAVQFATRVLGVLTGVKKATENVIDTNVALSQSSRESVKENESLVKSYEELSNKENLDAEEKRELNEVTQELIEKFGESVAVIDAETGALTINIAAVRQKIQADKVLASQAAQALLVEKQRLETAISLAENVDLALSSLRDQFTETILGEDFIDPSLAKVIDAAGSSGFELAGVIQDIRLGFVQSGQDSTEFENKLAVLLPRLNSIAKATSFVGQNRLDLLKINQELLDIGIDLNDLAEDTLNNAKKEGDAKEKQAKQTKDRIKLLQQEVKALRDTEAITVEEITLRNKAIKVINDQIKALQALGLEKDKQNEESKIKLLEEEDASDEAFIKETERRNKLLEDEKRRAKEHEALQDARISTAKNLATVLGTIAGENEAAQKAAADLQKALAVTEIIINSNREISEIRASEDDDTLKRAKVFEARTAAVVGITSVLSAFDGVDDTGGRGNVDSRGGKQWTLHPHEQVDSLKDRKDKADPKTGKLRTRAEIKSIVNMHDKGSLLMSPHAFKQVEMGNVVSHSDIDFSRMIQSQNENTQQLSNVIKKNATSLEISSDGMGRLLTRMEKGSMAKVTTYKRDGGSL